MKNNAVKFSLPSFLSGRSIAAASVMGLALTAAMPDAHAHRSWLLPSATVLSGTQPWVTVDAAVSNDLFYFEHQPLRLDGLQVTAPDGKAVEAQNTATGRYRSTFDVKLDQTGTYRIAIVSDGMMASYKIGNETKRWRGAEKDLKSAIPQGATDVNVSRNHRRVETLVTAGKPNTTALTTTNAGLELVPVTHPNDLFQGEEATFKFVFDGKPVAGMTVEVVQEGIRYQNKLNEVEVTTNDKGEFKVTWPHPGKYWISADWPQRVAGAPAPVGTIDKPVKRAGYAATVEVLPQ